MIALAEQTALSWAEETSWGARKKTAHRRIPLITDNLGAQRRQVRTQKLTASHLGESFFTADESAVGDIDFVPNIGILREALKCALMTSVIDIEAHNLFITARKANQATLTTALHQALQSDDVLWAADAVAGTGKWCRFTPATPASRAGELHDLAGNLITRNSNLRVRLRRFDPGQVRRSLTLIKKYGNASDWLEFTGMMVRRLELATNSDQMLTASASLAGKAMAVVDSAPTYSVAETAQPLFLGSTDISLVLEKSPTEKIDLTASDDFTLTGFRLVLEQAGLQPRYGLGSRYPEGMLGGKLLVYGTLDVMAGSHELMEWFADAEAAILRCYIRFSDAVGFGFALPRMRISEIVNAPLTAGEPVRHILRFDGEKPPNSDSNSGASLVHFYTS